MNIDYKGYEGTKLDIKDDTIIRKYYESINKDSIDFALDVNKYDYDEVKAVSDNRKNIISWYKGFNGKSVLELNADYGQITSEIIKTASKVVSVEPIKEKAEAIGRRIELDSDNSDKLTIKVCNPLKLNLKEKFDIVTLIGIDNENNNIEKYIEIAKKHLTDNGKILLAVNNKFGLKYFSGIKEKQEDAYNDLLGKSNIYATKFDVDSLLKKNGFKFKVFYPRRYFLLFCHSYIFYPIPNYEFTNAIFTDEFLPNEELILSRDLFFFDDKKEVGRFAEREVLKEIVKKNKFLFKDVCNSYLYEINVNKDDKLSSVKFVSFGLLRKIPFRIKTIIDNVKVRKFANNNLSITHIERIKTNIELLEKAGIKTIDRYKEEKVGDKKIVFIENDYIENSKTLDREIVDLLKNGNKDEALDKIRKFKADILDKFEVKTSNLNRNIFTANGVKVHGGKIKKLHFIEEGLIDLIFQNTFVIDGKLVPYDQEWLEVNTPIEYILFRCFRYMPELNEYFDINDLYKEFGIDEFVEEFISLDEKMQSLLRDEIFWDMHVKSIGNIEANKGNKEVVDELEDRIKDLEKLVYDKDVHINNLENIISNNKNEIASFQNQIAVISNSFSWKITKPIRFLSWMFNPFSHATFIDRIMPPGGRRRQKYDEKLASTIYLLSSL